MADKYATYPDWVAKHQLRESDDYDMHGAFAAGVQPDERGHLPDTYKLPNHITYSEESLAAAKKGAPPAGRWAGDDETGWSFYASPTNIENAGGVDALTKYFRKNEPGVKLILPEGHASGGVVIDHNNPAKRERLI